MLRSLIPHMSVVDSGTVDHAILQFGFQFGLYIAVLAVWVSWTAGRRL